MMFQIKLRLERRTSKTVNVRFCKEHSYKVLYTQLNLIRPIEEEGYQIDELDDLIILNRRDWAWIRNGFHV